MICPICGHSVIETGMQKRPYSALYGPPVEVELVHNTCSNCGSDGDFEGVNSTPIQQALELSALRSVPLMMKRLKDEHDCSTAYIERVTGLQFGSINRCADGHYDGVVIMALRLVLTYPPLLLLLDQAYGMPEL